MNAFKMIYRPVGYKWCGLKAVLQAVAKYTRLLFPTPKIFPQSFPKIFPAKNTFQSRCFGVVAGFVAQFLLEFFTLGQNRHYYKREFDNMRKKCPRAPCNMIPCFPQLAASELILGVVSCRCWRLFDPPIGGRRVRSRDLPIPIFAELRLKTCSYWPKTPRGKSRRSDSARAPWKWRTSRRFARSWFICLY